jgi:hypothetical protein
LLDRLAYSALRYAICMSPTAIAYLAASFIPAIVFAIGVLLWAYMHPRVVKPWVPALTSLFWFVVWQQAASLLLWLFSIMLPHDEWHAHDVQETYNRNVVLRELGAAVMAGWICIRILIASWRDAEKGDLGRAANDGD